LFIVSFVVLKISKKSKIGRKQKSRRWQKLNTPPVALSLLVDPNGEKLWS
jgi:hypothetical protein